LAGSEFSLIEEEEAVYYRQDYYFGRRHLKRWDMLSFVVPTPMSHPIINCF